MIRRQDEIVRRATARKRYERLHPEETSSGPARAPRGAPRARGTETDFADEVGGPRRSCDRDAGEGGRSNEGGGGENDFDSVASRLAPRNFRRRRLVRRYSS